MSRPARLWMFLPLLLLPSFARAASLLPLSVQEARTLPNGVAEGVLSIGYVDGLWFPEFTEPGTVANQQLLAAPTIGFHIGLGDRVEVQASYELLLLSETQLGVGHVSNYGSGDARLFTKVRLFSEEGWRPTAAIRFGTKLPNANAGDHLGDDRTDWGGELIASKLLGPVDVHVNLGLQILDDPFRSGQDDLLSYDIGVSSQELAPPATDPVSFRLVGEVAGLSGSRFGNDRSAVRGGFQIRYDAFTFFGGVSAGLIRESENIGGLAGVIWTFQTFGDPPPADQKRAGSGD